ncbi:DUF624 domain-containing protein [Mycoplasmatota bacterium]|nr:DUF624 domain-containing protein [Mycoplasmatota bacterium]
MDFEKYANSKAYSFFDILYKLMVINCLWFFSLIIGLGFLTFLPATISLFILVYSLMKESEFPVFKSFWTILKKKYWKGQIVFLLMLIMGLGLYFNFRIYYINHLQNYVSSIGFWLTCILILVYLLTFLQVFMIFIYFPKFNAFQIIKYAFLFALAYPFRSLFLLLIYGLVTLVLFMYPFIIPLIFLLVVSLLAYLSIKVMKPRYDKVLKDKTPLDIYDYID